MTFLSRSGMNPQDADALLSLLPGATAAVHVVAQGALTSPATMSGAYTLTEVQHVRDDVAAARTAINALITSLQTAGILAAS